MPIVAQSRFRNVGGVRPQLFLYVSTVVSKGVPWEHGLILFFNGTARFGFCLVSSLLCNGPTTTAKVSLFST